MSNQKVGGADIAGHLLIERKTFSDFRGSLLKVFEDQDSAKLSFPEKIKQINLVESTHIGTIRGMHVQPHPFTESKLITCIKGVVFDVVIDLRKDSSTFLKWSAYLLDATNNHSIVVPSGCAHGMQALSENSTLLYVHTNDFTAKYESCLNPFDPDLAISWPISASVISQRDSKLPTLAQWLRDSNEV